MIGKRKERLVQAGRRLYLDQRPPPEPVELKPEDPRPEPPDRKTVAVITNSPTTELRVIAWCQHGHARVILQRWKRSKAGREEMLGTVGVFAGSVDEVVAAMLAAKTEALQLASKANNQDEIERDK